MARLRTHPGEVLRFVVFGALRGRMETATNLVEVLAEHSGSIRMLD
jgi:hypothetical protein